MPEIIYGEQGTDEWHDARLGSIGGSSVTKIMPKGKGREDLLYHLCGEILSGQKTEGPAIKWYDRGHEFEPKAREYYEFLNGVDVEQVALIKSGIPRIHVSPDGLVGEDGGIEIKVRLAHIFLKLKDTEKIPIADVRQCQHFLWVSERQFCDYIAFCPELPNPCHITRLERDEKLIKEIKTEVFKFLIELEEIVKRLK